MNIFINNNNNMNEIQKFEIMQNETTIYVIKMISCQCVCVCDVFLKALLLKSYLL